MKNMSVKPKIKAKGIHLRKPKLSGAKKWIKKHPYVFTTIILLVVFTIGGLILGMQPYVNQGFVDWHPTKIAGHDLQGTQYDYWDSGNHYMGNIYCSNLVGTGAPVDIGNYTLSDGRVAKVRNYYYTGHVVADTTAKASTVVPASPTSVSIAQTGLYGQSQSPSFKWAYFPAYSIPGTQMPYYQLDADGLGGNVLYSTVAGTDWRTATDNYRVSGPITMSVTLNPLLQGWDLTSKDDDNYYVLDGTWAGVVAADAMTNSSYGLTSTGGAVLASDLGSNPVSATDAISTQTAGTSASSAVIPTATGVDVGATIAANSAGKTDTRGNGFGNGLGINVYSGAVETQGAYCVGETAGNKLSIYQSNGTQLASNFTWDESMGNMLLSNVEFNLTCNMQPQTQVYYSEYEYEAHQVELTWLFVWFVSKTTVTSHKVTVPTALACDNVYVDYEIKLGAQLASVWNVVPVQFAQGNDSTAANYVPDLSSVPSTWATNNTYNNDVLGQITGFNTNYPGLDLGAILFWIVVIAVTAIAVYLVFFRKSSGSSGSAVTVNVNAPKTKIK